MQTDLETISHYKVLEKLGAGGMGEVYLAEDTRLHRRAALKVLPTAFAAHRKHLNRFWQEARLAATLNHPNICTVYEINDQREAPFIALEYVEGETLAAKIDGSKTLEAGAVLEIAEQIADALDEAHSRGIIHRDIKPANVIVDKRGRVKVLDFGLAKTFETEISEQELTRAKTESGMLAGTVQYMSPEQALGKDLDGRTDLWSLGVLLYEMTTGELPFRGATIAAVFDAILHDEPVLPSELAPNLLSPALEQIVLKLLEKDRDLRYQTASDLRADLRRLQRNSSVSVRRASGEIKTERTESGLTKQTVALPIAKTQNDFDSKKKRRLVGFGFALATIFILAAGAWAIYSNFSKPPEVSANFQQTEIERLTNYGKVTDAVISPDGKFMAYVVDDSGSESLWLKQLGTNTKLQLVAPANVSFQGIALSPDSNWVYYNFWDKQSVGQIYRVPTIAAATPQKIVHDCMPGVILAPDGKRLAFVRSNGKNFELSFLTADAHTGGDERALINGQYENIGILAAAWSPDGAKIAYSNVKMSADGQPQATISEISATGGGEPKIIWSQPNTIFGNGLVWLPEGKGFLATIQNQQQSTAQIWQISSASGETRQITKDFNGYGNLSVTADGNSLVTTQQDFALSVWVAPAADPNAARRVTTGKLEGAGLAWTADNRIVYTSTLSGNFDLWIMNADGSGKRQLTANAGNNTEPCVFDGGKRVAFVSTRNGSVAPQVWQINLETGETARMTTGAGAFAVVCSFADAAVYTLSIKDANFPRVWQTALDGEKSPVEMEKSLSYRPAVSPDGKHLAYIFWDQQENRLRQEILTIATGEKKGFQLPLAAIRGVNQPPITFRWTPDGRAISYVGDETQVSNVWTLPLAGNAKPKQITSFDENYILYFDWSPDGKHLAVSRGARSSDAVLIRNAR